jgi:hypothetical protein
VSALLQTVVQRLKAPKYFKLQMIYGQAWSFHILLERFTGGIPSFWGFPNDLLARGRMIYWLAAQ